MEKLRVWWIPQVNVNVGAFYVPVKSVEEGKKVMDILAAYDIYQEQNDIKPDYTNAGGLQRWNVNSQDWEDWDMETEYDFFDDVNEYCKQCANAKELEKFTYELFKQVD